MCPEIGPVATTALHIPVSLELSTACVNKGPGFVRSSRTSGRPTSSHTPTARSRHGAPTQNAGWCLTGMKEGDQITGEGRVGFPFEVATEAGARRGAENPGLSSPSNSTG